MSTRHIASIVAAAAVCLLPTLAQAQPAQTPLGVIYDFDVNAQECDPDNWTFFGWAQRDFGWTSLTGSGDGNGAFQYLDWEYCDGLVDPDVTCRFAGATIGMGKFQNCKVDQGGAGVDDAELNLTLGTALRVRIRAELGAPGSFGTETRVALIMRDADGTTAVTPGTIDHLKFSLATRNAIHEHCAHRIQDEDYHTYTFLFKQLTWLWDEDHSTHGSTPGLDLSHITMLNLFWYRGCQLVGPDPQKPADWDCSGPESAQGKMTLYFDEVELVDVADYPYLDTTMDGTVDLADFAAFQECAGVDPPVGTCDGTANGVLDNGDMRLLDNCLKGPSITMDDPRNLENYEYLSGWCYPTIIDAGYIAP